MCVRVGPCYTYIVNLSIRSGSVPGTLKDARVVPLFKKNKRSDVSNYRPVSHGGESRDILHIYSDRTGKHIRHFFFNAE